MADHQAMMDTICDGHINNAVSVIPDYPQQRATHLKAFAYFQDASLVGIGPIIDEAWLSEPIASLLRVRLAPVGLQMPNFTKPVYLPRKMQPFYLIFFACLGLMLKPIAIHRQTCASTSWL